MLDHELAEIVYNLRVLGSDIDAVEAKRAQDTLPKSIRATLSAFANTRGGTVVLGLDEKTGFTATGVRNPAKMMADLASLCATDMEPPLRPQITVHQFEGVSVLVAEIPALELARRPCFHVGAGLTQGSFVRVGDGDHKLSSYEVQMMIASRGQPREDEEPVRGIGADQLDPVLVEALIARLRTSRPFSFAALNTSDALRRAKVVVPDGEGGLAVSLAGLLALGSYPQEHFPKLMVTFVHFPMIDGPGPDLAERFLDNVSIEGPIPIMVRDALAAIRRNMSRRAIVTGAGRLDVWDYPEAALREAIVNALVHRDLSGAARGAQVQIEMYPDRLVVQSPGGLFGPLTVDNIAQEGMSSTRNVTLMRILEDVQIPHDTRTVCESRGTGIRTMLRALRSAKMSPPRFDDRITSFTVTFPRHTLFSDTTIAWINDLGERGLTESQCTALAMVKDGEILDNRSYRTATGLDSRVATAELQDLVARELVTQYGTRRCARYELASGIDSARTQHRVNRRGQILAALGDDVLSRVELVERTGLPDSTIRRWILILKKEGVVDATAAAGSRNVRYRRTGQQYLT